MPADRSSHSIYNDEPWFTQRRDERSEMRNSVYMPSSLGAFATFIAQNYADLDELRGYEHEVLSSLALDLAERSWQDGVDADTMVRRHFEKQAEKKRRAELATTQTPPPPASDGATVRTIYIGTITHGNGRIETFSQPEVRSPISA